MTEEPNTVFEDIPPAGYEIAHSDVTAGESFAIDQDCFVVAKDTTITSYTKKGDSYSRDIDCNNIRDIAVGGDIYTVTDEMLTRRTKFGSKKRQNNLIDDGQLCSRVDGSNNVAVLAEDTAIICDSETLVKKEPVDVSFLNEEEITAFISTKELLIAADDNYCFCYPYDEKRQEWYIDVENIDDSNRITSVSILGDAIVLATETSLLSYGLKSGDLRWSKEWACDLPSGMYDSVIFASDSEESILITEDGAVTSISRDHPELLASKDIGYIYDPSSEEIFARTENVVVDILAEELNYGEGNYLQIKIANTTADDLEQHCTLTALDGGLKQDELKYNLHTPGCSLNTYEIGPLTIEDTNPTVELQLSVGDYVASKTIEVQFPEPDVEFTSELSCVEHSEFEFDLELLNQGEGPAHIYKNNPDGGIGDTLGPGDSISGKITKQSQLGGTEAVQISYSGPGIEETIEIKESLDIPDQKCTIEAEMDVPGTFLLVIKNGLPATIKDTLDIGFSQGGDVIKTLQREVDIDGKTKSEIKIEPRLENELAFDSLILGIASDSPVIPNKQIEFDEYRPISTSRMFYDNSGNNIHTISEASLGERYTEVLEIRNESDVDLSEILVGDNMTVAINSQEKTQLVRDVAVFDSGRIPETKISVFEGSCSIEPIETDKQVLTTPPVECIPIMGVGEETIELAFEFTNHSSSQVIIKSIEFPALPDSPIGSGLSIPIKPGDTERRSKEYPRDNFPSELLEGPVAMNLRYENSRQGLVKVNSSLIPIVEQPDSPDGIYSIDFTAKPKKQFMYTNIPLNINKVYEGDAENPLVEATDASGIALNVEKSSADAESDMSVTVKEKKLPATVILESETDEGQYTDKFEIDNNRWKINRLPTDSPESVAILNESHPAVVLGDWSRRDA